MIKNLTLQTFFSLSYYRASLGRSYLPGQGHIALDFQSLYNYRDCKEDIPGAFLTCLSPTSMGDPK